LVKNIKTIDQVISNLIAVKEMYNLDLSCSKQTHTHTYMSLSICYTYNYIKL